ncbi:uncharacterized protein LOC131699402 isoform X2 [Acipenser ruthenus]|nr:uncharacterized protein LOC131699402 isoform X2 [Acipenser ruthenus]
MENYRRRILEGVRNQLQEQDIDPSFIGDDLMKEDVFDGINTRFKLDRYARNHFSYVEPKEVVLGHRIGHKKKNHKRQMTMVDDTFIYISLLDSLKQLLSSKPICDMILSPPLYADPSVLSNMCDGHIFRSHPLFVEHQTGLQILLYYDEAEVDNPIGNKAGKHKLGMFYYTLGNINVRYRSKLEAIRLLAIIKSQDKKKYGIDRVLKEIQANLTELSNGVEMHGRVVHGAAISFSGDTLAAHEVGGFKEGVGFAFQKCRHCECTFDRMQNHFIDSDFVTYCREMHEVRIAEIERAATDDLRNVLRTVYGINRRSELTNFPYFNVTSMLPEDIMHVILEGVAQYEVKECLKFWIHNAAKFRLDEFNLKVKHFDYGYACMKSKPQMLQSNCLDSEDNKLKQNADEMWTLLKHLLLILNELCISDDPHYTFIKELVEITHIAFSPCVCVTTLACLRVLIKEHLKHFKQLFPHLSIIPKQHYLLHIPKLISEFGPLVHVWCMRFEGKHSYFKRLAKQQNHINICKSLAERNQKKELRESLSKQHPLFSNEREVGSCKVVNGEERNLAEERMTAFNIENSDTIYTANWVKINGVKYCCEKAIVTSGTSPECNFLPLFGKIRYIWITNSHIYFALQLYDTVSFDEERQCYVVENPDLPSAFEVVSANQLLDHSVYNICCVKNEMLIPIHYDLIGKITEWALK